MKLKTLSTAQQNAWIDRIFELLGGMYGREFTLKWSTVEIGTVKEAWVAALLPYDSVQIGQALKACQGISKAPNAPEFAELCRQFWASSQELEHAENTRHLTLEEKTRFIEITKAAVKPVPDNKRAWAQKIIARQKAGEPVNGFSLQAAHDVLAAQAEVPAREPGEEG